MSACINHVCNKLLQDIDRSILEQAFKPPAEFNLYNNHNLFSIIADRVIRQYVMPDLNAEAGESIVIPLHELSYRQLDNVYIYEIPLNLTHGRHLSVVHALENQGSDSGPGGATMTNKAAHAAMGPESTGTARVKLIAPNTIAIYDHVAGYNLFLRGELEFDPELSTITPRYYNDFTELCLLACKHLIHVNLANKAGDGALYGGAPSDYFRSTIDSYADSRELYREELKKWGKRVLMMDRNTNNRLVRLSLGGII